ncbi:MAG: hypothetical protein MUO33_12165 [Sedimentisphaerales bacterium]|nr:hypothetical protein [Sedimentisphaerales bacterium]
MQFALLVVSMWQGHPDPVFTGWKPVPPRYKKMAEPSGSGAKGPDPPIRIGVSKEIREYVDSLSNEHRMLVVLKAQLYDGTWEPMLDDLRNRLAGKPYIFKLVNRIQDDIKRIEQMQEFESEHNIDLADYVELR